MNRLPAENRADARHRQSEFAAALLDSSSPIPSGLKTWNGSDPNRRFAVYRNNVVVSLVDALADGFPVTLELVGDEFFRAMARLFAISSPPRSPMLFEYGDEFPAFIEQFEPASALPYLSDVARLEYARTQAMHAADAVPIELAAFQSLLADPATLPMLRVELHPSHRLIRFRHGAVSLWAAHQGEADLAAVDWSVAEDALIARPALDVEIRRLPAGGWAFLRALGDSGSLAEAIAAATADSPEFDLVSSLGILVHSGIVMATSLTLERER